MFDAIIARIDKLIRSRLDAAITSRLASNDARLNSLDSTVSSRLSAADSRLAALDAAISSRLSAADSRLAALDVAISSRLASNDGRLGNLNATISSRLASDDPRLNYLNGPMSEPAQAIRSARGVASSSDTVILNVSGTGGSLQGIGIAGVPSSLKVTIDGGTEYDLIAITYAFTASSGNSIIPLHVKFNTSCIVKAKSTGSTINVNVLYGMNI